VTDRARVRVPIPSMKEGVSELDAAAAHYLVRVHRLESGGHFLAFDPARALEADGELVALHPSVVARIGPLRPAALRGKREITWIQALPKGEKMDSIVRDATELGATRIVPVTTTFTVVKLEGPRREARRERWERIASEAARQCGRGDAPRVLPVTTWEEALGSAPLEDSTGGEARFCLYEKAAVPLGPLLRDVLCSARTSAVTFAVGPEGGLSEREVLDAGARGFAVVSLGPFTLRAETVVAATLGALGVLEGLADDFVGNLRDEPGARST